jgi:hypothetical protein
MNDLNNKEITVEIGCGDKVTVNKLFGPLIFTNLRITADFESCSWIIERQWIENGNYIEWCRIPGQYDEEFRKDD